MSRRKRKTQPEQEVVIKEVEEETPQPEQPEKNRVIIDEVQQV